VFRKEIIVTVKRKDGRVEVRRVVVDEKVSGGGGGDLVTLWAFRLICCVFTFALRGSTVSFDFIDLGGVSRTQRCIGTDSGDFFGSGCADRAPYIGFGSSSASPSRTDSKLLTELARVRGSRVVDESAFSCSIVGSWSPASDVTVCEVGLYMFVCDSGGVARYVLFDRSVLSPCVSVSAGETISVSYVFRF
jgi:hypothetical protein